MPETQINIYQTEDGEVPLRTWLDKQNKKVQEKAYLLIELLEERGHALRRPHADFLNDGIYELRIIVQRVQHRILYAFVGKQAVLLTHGLTKEKKVPQKEIDRACEYKAKYEKNPAKHTYYES